MSATDDEASVSRATWATETRRGILRTSFPSPAFFFPFLSFLVLSSFISAALCEMISSLFASVSFLFPLFFSFSDLLAAFATLSRDCLPNFYPVIDHGYWYNLYTHAGTCHHLCILPMYIPVPASEAFELFTSPSHAVPIQQASIYWSAQIAPSASLYLAVTSFRTASFSFSFCSGMPSVSTDRPLIFLHMPSTYHVYPINLTQATFFSRSFDGVTHAFLWIFRFQSFFLPMPLSPSCLFLIIFILKPNPPYSGVLLL